MTKLSDQLASNVIERGVLAGRIAAKDVMIARIDEALSGLRQPAFVATRSSPYGSCPDGFNQAQGVGQ